MYITYETAQSVRGPGSRGYIKHSQPPVTIPNEFPKTDFIPSKLVRISDMKVVDGSQVNEGYCALSYSWNQSGNILLDIITKKYKRIDEGKHEIISYDNIYPDMIIPQYKTRHNMKLRKIYKVFEIMEYNNYYFTSTVQFVKFEVIIQQLCQQFNIKYIWYDQLCINQDNQEEKQREIHNMHHIYENAYCTVALVPDYSRSNFAIIPSTKEYFKRLWTLEEAIKSKRILFVGRNVHHWEDIMFEIDLLTKSSSELSVSQILYHAHQRTSTKDHDRVFALIHLFPEFMDEINIDYDQPFEDLMIQFYGLLAKKGISILYFDRIRGRYFKSTIKKYNFLPSWTGVNGKHISDNITTSFQNYDIIGKTMHVTTTFITNNQSIDDDNLTIREEDIPTMPDDINDFGDKRNYCLYILVQLPKAKEMKRIDLGYYGRYSNFSRKSFLDKISKELQHFSRFMEIKKENLCWYNIGGGYHGLSTFNFEGLTDGLDDSSAHYVILSEISFNSRYPVIKKEQGEEFYKAIGCCKIERNEDFFSDCNLNKGTFLIQ